MAMVARVKPRRASGRGWISGTDSSPIGTSGLGSVVVKGRRRVPRPPARITACIGGSGCSDIELVHLVASMVGGICEPRNGARETLAQVDGRPPPGRLAKP